MIELLSILAVGLTFGSFVTMASYRLPLGKEIVRMPSHCVCCNATLKIKDLWPVFSWLASNGKCTHCGAKVSARYPLTEIATAALFLMVWNSYGASPLAVILALMGVALLIMVVVDLEHYIIPDQIHIALLPLAVWFHYVKATPVSDVVLGGLCGGGLGLALHYGYRYLRKKEGLGFGDVKFFAMAGLWLTWKWLAPFLFIAGLLGIVTGIVWRALGKGAVFPFGPALAASLFLCVAYSKYTNLYYYLEKFLL